MPRWIAQISVSPWEQAIEAPYMGIEHGALVFRDAAGGVILQGYGPGIWKAVVQSVDVPPSNGDLFISATREIVQG
jgi:hypothetical protein